MIDFPGDRFSGEIAPAVSSLVERGLIRILDLVIVKRDADGVVLTFEYDDLAETAGANEPGGARS